MQDMFPISVDGSVINPDAAIVIGDKATTFRKLMGALKARKLSVDDLTSKLASSHRLIEDNASTYGRVMEENQRFANQIRQHKNEMNAAEEKAKAFQQEIERLGSGIPHFSVIIDAKDEEISQLKEENHSLQESGARSAEQIRSLASQVDTQIEIIRSKNEELHSFTEDNDYQQETLECRYEGFEELHRGHSDRFIAHEKEITSHKKWLKRLETRMDQVETRLETD